MQHYLMQRLHCLQHVECLKVKLTTSIIIDRHHTIQEGDWFCFPELEIVWIKYVNQPRKKAADLVKMLAEGGVTVSFFTVKCVLYSHGRKGHSTRKNQFL
ncbi:hypothetical protein AMECASPLE_032215 [Ameca splendens]|uniref:Uncharacterized protein n=1 Tax=Ameca splendens TaxID=208324 RepID=A0ABV0YIQ6_9TELE